VGHQATQLGRRRSRRGRHAFSPVVFAGGPMNRACPGARPGLWAPETAVCDEVAV